MKFRDDDGDGLSPRYDESRMNIYVVARADSALANFPGGYRARGRVSANSDRAGRTRRRPRRLPDLKL